MMYFIIPINIDSIHMTMTDLTPVIVSCVVNNGSTINKGQQQFCVWFHTMGYTYHERAIILDVQ